MSVDRTNLFHVDPHYADLLRAINLTPDTVFSHPDIHIWRSISDRQNGTLDTAFPDGQKIRLHIKRYHPVSSTITPAHDEARGLTLLAQRGIPTAPLVAWGKLPDRRSFIVLEDLTGYRAGDKLVEDGFPFARLLEPTADLAARLHTVGLHHRDLYLCHFFTQVTPAGIDLKLIDAARVRPRPWFFRTRWIIKDLAQFWYSTLSQPITDEQRTAWLNRYAQQRGLTNIDQLRRRIERKTRWMARHDLVLNRKQPHRNIPIPTQSKGI